LPPETGIASDGCAGRGRNEQRLAGEQEESFVATNPDQHVETLDELAVRYQQLLQALKSNPREEESVRELLAVATISLL
jgi:hypothetical protein